MTAHVSKSAVHVSKSQFKARALELFRAIEESGEPMIITDRGKPVLEVRPVKEKPKVDPLEKLKGRVIWYDQPFEPAVDDDDWEVLR